MRRITKRRLLKGVKPLDPSEAEPHLPRAADKPAAPYSYVPMGQLSFGPIGRTRYLPPVRRTTWDDVWQAMTALQATEHVDATTVTALTEELRVQQARGDPPPALIDEDNLLDSLDDLTVQVGPTIFGSRELPNISDPFMRVSRSTYDRVLSVIQNADSISIGYDENGEPTAAIYDDDGNEQLHCFIDDLGECFVHPDAYAHLADMTESNPE